jgi:predicted lipoprotein with Yx(FWY)xxD motif
MLRHIFAGATFGALILAGCGGGGGGGVTPSGGGNTSTGPGAASTPASTPQQASVAGSMGFVGSNGFTLYVFSADTANTSNCNSSNGCSGVWPPYTAPAGTSAANTSFTLITRSDGSLQWAYKGAPLYNYSGDTGAAQSNGQGITSFGGSWSVGRPTSTSSGGSGGSGYGITRNP